MDNNGPPLPPPNLIKSFIEESDVVKRASKLKEEIEAFCIKKMKIKIDNMPDLDETDFIIDVDE